MASPESVTKETKGITDKISDYWILCIGVSKLRYFQGAEDWGVPASLVIR